MKDKNVIIYVSDNNPHCKKVLNQMDKWDVSYKIKNVTQNSNYMRDLQDQGIYGTPATFIKDKSKVILGFQKNEIKHALGLDPL